MLTTATIRWKATLYKQESRQLTKILPSIKKNSKNQFPNIRKVFGINYLDFLPTINEINFIDVMKHFPTITYLEWRLTHG